MLQQCVLNGLFSGEEARRLLISAAKRHEDAAEGSDEKITLNMEAAHLIRARSSGLEPLFREQREQRAEQAKKPKTENRPNWVRFPE